MVTAYIHNITPISFHSLYSQQFGSCTNDPACGDAEVVVDDGTDDGCPGALVVFHVHAPNDDPYLS